jgi:hypothetical protein
MLKLYRAYCSECLQSIVALGKRLLTGNEFAQAYDGFGLATARSQLY